MSAKVKAYVSQLTIHFGNTTTVGALYPIRAVSKAPKFKFATPDGKEVAQVYRDEDGKLWDKGSLKRGVVNEETGELELVSAAKVEEAKESTLPYNVMTLTAHLREQVDARIFPSNNQAYIFKPIKKDGKKIIKDEVNIKWYDMINTVLRDTDVALLGMCNLKNFEGLFRLGLYQGYITVQKQLYPEELNQFDYYTPNVESAVREKAARKTVEQSKVFDATDYVNQIAERLCSIVPGAVEDDVKTEPLAPVASEVDMLAALDDFVL